ncbi:MAG: hypothetical protein EON88_14180, partial [Brevundimonas sp.]
MDLTPPQHDEEDTAQKRRKTARWLIAALIVAGLHIGLFSLLAVTRPDVLPVDSRVIDVILFRPPPVSPPPASSDGASTTGGGGETGGGRNRMTSMTRLSTGNTSGRV